MIELSKQIEDAIKEKNITLVRASIKTFINKDRWLEKSQVAEYAEYVEKELKKEGVELFVEDDKEFEFSDKNEWNKDLWILMLVKIGHNFSREKFQFILDIMLYLRTSGHVDFQSQVNETKINNDTTSDLAERKVKNSIVGAIFGGIIGLGVGSLIGRPIIGCIAGISILGSAGYSLKNKKQS